MTKLSLAFALASLGLAVLIAGIIDRPHPPRGFRRKKDSESNGSE